MAIVNSSAYSYGTNAFGADSFGVDVLPIESASSATVSADSVRVKFGSASVAATSSTNALGGFFAGGSATVTASSSATNDSTRVREGAQVVVATASVSARAVADYVSGAISSGTLVTVSVGEKFILEESSAFAYGTSTYGSNVYDYADFQTIVAATSTNSWAIGAATRQSGAQITSSSSFTVGGNVTRVREGDANPSAIAVGSAVGVFTVSARAGLQAQSTFSADFLRFRNTGGTSAATASIATIGREKWEPYVVTSETWTPIPATSETWTKLAA